MTIRLKYSSIFLMFTFFLLYSKECYSEVVIEIPAHVEVQYSTTTNVKKRSFGNENAGATDFVFETAKQLYAPIDNLKKPIHGFSVASVKISAPSLNGTENVSFSVSIAYKENMAGSASQLFYKNGVTCTQMKNGQYTMSSGSGLSTFNATLFSDIADTAHANRQLNFMFFVVKVKVDGAGASSIDLDKLDLQLDLVANVTTTFKSE